MEPIQVTHFAHLKIPLEKVVEATNNFAEKHIIGRGGFGNVYQGKLIHSGESIKIAARRLGRNQWQGEAEFWTEISMLSTLEHENIVSLIGYCDEEGEKIIINRHYPKGSLSYYLNRPYTLSWDDRMDICCRVARAIAYIHHKLGKSYYVIHRNINSSTIVLDDKMHPRVSGFEHSIKHSVDRRGEVCLCDEAIRTLGYMDPAIEKSGGVTHKSDIYSLGIVLFEILCGRKANEDNKPMLGPLAKFHYENGTMEKIIHPRLWEQLMTSESFKCFARAAYSCLHEDRTQRPDADQLCDKLDRAYKLRYNFVQDMEPTQVTRLKIPLEKVLEATNNFAKKNIIGKSRFGNVYRGELIHLGESIEIAARRLARNHLKGEIEFWTEISMLSTLKHAYIVSLIGYCDEEGEKIIINRHYPKGSLSNYLNRPSTLNWDDRMDICCRVARAIGHIHHKLGKSYHVIHRNVNSSTIVLDDKMHPRLSGFEYSVKHSVDRRDELCLCDEATGATGYTDPVTKHSGGVTHKTDIYSLGIVLFEMLCGRKANEDNKPMLGPLAKFHYENGTLEKITHPHLWEQIMKSESFECFAEAAYSCLDEDRTQCPDADQLCYKLDKAYKLRYNYVQDMETPELQTIHGAQEFETEKTLQIEKKSYLEEMEETLRTQVDIIDKSIPSRPWKIENLERWRIEIGDIWFATENLPASYGINRPVAYTYATEVHCYDRERVLHLKGMNKDGLPKKYYNATMKVINSDLYREKYGEEYMSTEIEVLSSCNHGNIVSFLGFCEKDTRRYVVYENISNQYLYSYVGTKNISWEKRLKICIDIARGLNYLHNEMEDQKVVIHRDVQSWNIVLNTYNWSAKIAEFEHAIFLLPNQNDDVLHLNKVTGNDHYMDPEYVETGKLKRELDVFSFGVIMLEILCGMSVDKLMKTEGQNEKDLAHLVGRWFDEEIIWRKLSPIIKGEKAENSFLFNKGINENSLNTFIKIIHWCVVQKQNQRPTMKKVVEELEKALSYQEVDEDTLKMSFENIKLATQNFTRVIGGGGFGKVFKGEIENNIIVAKKLDKSQGQGEKEFFNELQILYEYKHANIITLIGYSNETDAKIIVYEHASKGSLDKCLHDVRLTWKNRLKICIDVATALDFLHGGVGGKEVVIHRDIKTANILLSDDWKAKLGDFGLSLISTINKDSSYVIDRACGTMGYVDPLYFKSGLLTTESDIYSFGVVLFEILYGKAIYTIPKHQSHNLLSFIKQNSKEGRQDDVVFKAIVQEIESKSLTTFLNIVIKCLDDDREKRPTSKEVLTLLKKALDLQVGLI